MKNFSIFEQALKHSGVENIENIGEIASLARRDFIERESFICHTTTASVEYGCLMIENAILLRTNRSGRVYAGVEKLSALQPIIDRYMRIADVSETCLPFWTGRLETTTTSKHQVDHAESGFPSRPRVVCNYTLKVTQLRPRRV